MGTNEKRFFAVKQKTTKGKTEDLRGDSSRDPVLNHLPIRGMKLNCCVEDFYVLRWVSTKVTKKGVNYLAAILADNSGKIDVRVWDYHGEIKDTDKGKIVKVKGYVSEYGGTLRIIAEEIRLTTDADKFDRDQIIKCMPCKGKSAVLSPPKTTTGKMVAELKLNDRVEGLYIIQQAAIKVTSNGNPYLSAFLCDRSGKISVRVWNYGGPIGESDNGMVVKTKGTVTEFRGELQIIADDICVPEQPDGVNLLGLESATAALPKEPAKPLELIDRGSYVPDHESFFFCTELPGEA